MKRRRIIKDKSRIPGISVGDEVNTSVGEKKKVCFRVGGRWVFRMVDPEWRAPGRPQKGRGQPPPRRSGAMARHGGGKSEVGGQRQEAQPPRAETEGRKEKKGRNPKEGDGE